MNYDKIVRILPRSISFRHCLIIIIVFQSFVAGKKNQANKITDVNDDGKPLFDLTFGKNRNYTIDNCIPLAFGDFNADKVVDIFCRNTKGNTIRVMVNDDRSSTSKEQCNVTISGTIYDALAADFNGDSKLDLFILYQIKSDQIGYNGGILWGNRVNLSALQPLDYIFESIPTTLDSNGDSYVELLGMVKVNESDFRAACVHIKNHTRSLVEFLPNVGKLRPASTQASAELNHDFIADLFLTVVVDNKPKFRIYNLPISKLTLITEYDPPPDIAIYHLSTFADIDSDGHLDHLLPVCMDKKCSDSRIYVHNHNGWHLLPIHFGEGLRFPLENELQQPFNRIPMSIKTSDYNLDGHPDMAVIMRQSSSKSTIPILLQNKPCKGHTNLPCTYNRTFVPQMNEKFVLGATHATLVAFFDILENGYPDLLVVQLNEKNNCKLIGFHNSLVQDVHFIKVMVLGSFSCETCSRQTKLPYGNNQPGQAIVMETIAIGDGIKDFVIKLAAVQMAHAGQLTLELPYVIIGLDSTPNFVEKLTVGVPPTRDSHELHRTYTQMIPNSQIVVIPYPLLNPEKWHTKLFLTPSRMILHTGIALGVTLVVLAGVLATLQYREKIEDDRERKVQAQTFHYDAL